MYRFIIPNKKLVTYQILAYGILILNLLGFLIFNTKSDNQVFNIIPFAVAFILIAVYDFYRYKTKRILQSLGILILLCGVFWMRLDMYQLLFLNLLLWGLYVISRRRLVIQVTEDAISYPSFPRKDINWNETNNVILKDDMLTIDLKNNKIYQHLIEYADKEVNEAEFNEFCIMRVTISNKQ